MQDKKNYLTIGEASEYLGVSIDTLRRWEKKGRITPYRSPGGHRYYEKEELDSLFGKRYTRDEPQPKADQPLGQTVSHTTTAPVAEPQISPIIPPPTTPVVSTSDEEDNIFGSLPPNPPVPPPLTPSFVEKQHIPREIRLRPLEPVRITRQVVASASVDVVEIPAQPEKPPVVIESMRESVVETVTESQPAPPSTNDPLLNPKPAVLIPQVSFKSDTPVAKPRSRSEKKELISTIVIMSILILVIILGVILFLMLWTSSRSVLSPTP